jgi:hypothetical protein
VDQPEPVDGLDHLGLADLFHYCLDAPVGMDPEPSLPPAAVAQGMVAHAIRILRPS